MVMALILLAVGSLLVVPMLNQSFTNLGYHQSIECRTLTSYSADSGVEYVLCKLYNAPGAYTETPLQESFILNNRTVNVTAEYMGGGIYDITSVASGGGCGSTTIVCYVNLSAGSFAFAIAAEDYMYIDNTTVDSLPAPGGEANIHSNGDIDLVGAETVVNGDAFAVGTISGWDKVTGVVTFPSPPIQFPGDYSELYEMMAREGEDSPWEGDYIITGGTQYLGPLYINGDLIVENATLILEGTVYVTGMIRVEYGNLDGEQTVVAEGNISIEQGAVRSDIIPLIICTKVDGEIYSEWGTTVDGVLYAPYGSIRLENGVHLYGAAGGKTVNIQGCTITYAKELQGRQDLPGGELVTISYSYK